VSYLLDNSAFQQSTINLRAAEMLDRLTQSGELSICSVAMLEILYSARDARDWAQLRDALGSLPRVELEDPLHALDTQGELADRGQHRTSIVDVIVATTAAAHGLTVLHYDRDFERLAEVTGAEQQWIIKAGTGHRL
jgi:predicted nucleic acid-binding protein